MKVVIYHNPRCSKSRDTLDLLTERGIKPEVIEYLKTPLDKGKIAQILGLLGMSPRQLMRRGEPEYRNNCLDNPDLSDDQLLDAMVTYPILIQRPIVLADNKACIGRPPEKVMEIL